jgi:hypothetical protein
MKIGKSGDRGVRSSRVLLHVAVWPDSQQLGHEVQNMVGRIDILPRTAALCHPEVDQLLLEVTRNSIIAYDASNQPHHDCRVCISISAFHECLQQTLHEFHLFAVDLNAGVSETRLQSTHVAPALDLRLQLNIAPELP